MILPILILLIEIVVFVVYLIAIMVQVTKRRNRLVFVDRKMLTAGRTLSWGAVLSIVIVSNYLHTNDLNFMIVTTFLLIVYLIGSRLYVLSFRIKEENKDTWYYEWDQRLEKAYRQYLEPRIK